ncbi:MAG: PQQ-dependent dehydrogenase, methanol/ethanol family [Candidatus Eremiobacteraeota bacterium]|nr:PQQ-dependent dehydrogenase, methanol/ethanol family [Candidatus Eremiobacteraeota bacterium]
MRPADPSCAAPRAFLTLAAVCGVAAFAACGKPKEAGVQPSIGPSTGANPNGPAGAAATGAANPVMLERPARWYPPGTTDGNWLTTGRDYGMTRYSPLSEITPANVARLKMAWSVSSAIQHGFEATPLVAGNTMYWITPFPSRVHALDLTKPGAPIKWTFDPAPSPYAIGKACCDAVTRGAMIADGKVIYNLLDDHTIAVDTATGKEVWRTKMANVEDGTTMTMAPLVAGDKVYVGNSGGEMGVHGWLAALDVHTGKELWRAFSTGPDSLVRINNTYKPFYAWLSGRDLGATSWPADAWKHGAGASWGWVSYDPDLDMIYHGTSNPGPWNAAQRQGLNLFTSAVLARDANTGYARWAFQFTPHNQWDYDGVNDNVLADMPVNGRERKVMVQFNRNGYAYTIDRQTGEVIVVKPFSFLNWASGIDPKTMQPIIVPEKQTVPPGRWVRDICPTDFGASNWQPAAYSGRTGLFYAAVNNVCMDYKGRETSYIAGTPYWGTDMTRHPGPGGNYGAMIGWDAAAGRRAWAIPETFMVGGALPTASDLLFYGTVDGWFRAVDARTGKVLWSVKLGSGIQSAPMTYRGPDGHQYIAVVSGVGGFAMTSASRPGFPSRGGTLYVFTLPENIPAIPSPPGGQTGSGSGSQGGTQAEGGHR